MDMVKIFKVLHLFFLISWLGSLLVLPLLALPRPFFCVEGMQARLQKFYRTYQLPSMLAAILFGVILFILLPKHMKAGWFHMKLTGAVGLVALDLMFAIQLFKVKIHILKLHEYFI